MRTDANVPGQMTGKPLIESDRVEGTTVYDPRGTNIGSIKRLMIVSGKVAYAVLSFKISTYGAFEGMGETWSKLTYDTNLGSKRVRDAFRVLELRQQGRCSTASCSWKLLTGTR